MHSEARQKRAEKTKSQTELAEKAGVRQNTISRYVNGLTRLRFSTALKLMELLRQENKDI